MGKNEMSLTGFGSIPIGKRRAVVRDGIRRINGRQVDMLRRMAGEHGWSDDRLMQEARISSGDTPVTCLEDIKDGPPLQAIVAAMKGKGEK